MEICLTADTSLASIASEYIPIPEILNQIASVNLLTLHICIGTGQAGGQQGGGGGGGGGGGSAVALPICEEGWAKLSPRGRLFML